MNLKHEEPLSNFAFQLQRLAALHDGNFPYANTTLFNTLLTAVGARRCRLYLSPLN